MEKRRRDVYIFTDAKPYFRVKKDGKWTWVAAHILYSGYGNYVIQKLRDKVPHPRDVQEGEE